MTIEQAIFEALTEDSGVAAIVSRRVYPSLMPQNPTLPAIVYTLISGQQEESHDGPSGLARPRYQFDCYAETATGAFALSEALRLALHGFSGTLGGSGGVTCGGILFAGKRVLYESETRIHRVSIDYLIWHEEST
jgi:hypothetical protein